MGDLQIQLSDVKCTQNCGNDATCVVLDDDNIHLLCDNHENELARIDGLGMGGDTFWFISPNWFTDFVARLSERLQYWDKRYTMLIGKYSELQKASEQNCIKPST